MELITLSLGQNSDMLGLKLKKCQNFHECTVLRKRCDFRSIKSASYGYGISD